MIQQSHFGVYILKKNEIRHHTVHSDQDYAPTSYVKPQNEEGDKNT